MSLKAKISRKRSWQGPSGRQSRPADAGVASGVMLTIMLAVTLTLGNGSAFQVGAHAASPAANPANVFKVAKYPVQAQAEDAVTAKAQALADAQQSAFRSLMKRLVPVTAYKRLPKLPLARVQDMVAGFRCAASATRPLSTSLVTTSSSNPGRFVNYFDRAASSTSKTRRRQRFW